ncbi:MAG TPA: type II toxin-antitoxin system VapC family toxin [Rhizomicrobium sp.]|nr:type II toxin-antitoxin system VapC family toxin [Rhizomicrobium sp.]
MIFYLDTSLIVAATTNESRTLAVQHWLKAQQVEDLFISDLVVTEYSAALSIKVREKQMDAVQRSGSLAHFAQLCSSLTILTFQTSHFRAAARFADQYPLGLRTGYALHLAVAAEHGTVLVTLDKRLSQAGLALGIRTQLL